MRIFRDLEELGQALFIFNKLNTKEMLDSLGELITDRMRRRTRAGYGVTDNGKPKEKLADLSENYKAFRKEQRLSQHTRWNKSNLTFTGKMLDDITFKSGNAVLSIFLKTDLSEYKATEVSDRRPFFFLTKSELKEVQRTFEDKRDEYIRQYFS